MTEAWKVGFIALLLLISVSLGGVVAYQHQKANTLQDKITTLTTDLTKANEQIGQADASCKSSDLIIAQAQSEAEGYTNALDLINADLDKRLGESIKEAQVKQDDKANVVQSVDNSTDGVLLNSMWQSFCTVQPDDSDCTSRRNALKVPVR